MKHITIYLMFLLSCTLVLNLPAVQNREEFFEEAFTKEQKEEIAKIEKALEQEDEKTEIQEMLLLIEKLRKEADKIYYLM